MRPDNCNMELVNVESRDDTRHVGMPQVQGLHFAPRNAAKKRDAKVVVPRNNVPIEALERVLDACRKALRPGGRLLVNEYVGPSRFQWTPEQERLANQQLATLPEPLRQDASSGGLKVAIHRPTVAEMITMDPSEAVRSAEIEPALRERFAVKAQWNWGGTVNFLVLQEIAGNFDPANDAHNVHVDRLIADENRWIADGTLPSDFKMYLLE